MNINPLFFIVAIYFIAVGKAALFAGYTIAILVHEYSHILMAKIKGYNLGNITIMPYGGRVCGYTYNSCFDGIIIALAGPISNVVFGLLIMALWSLFDNAKSLTFELVRANFYLGLINLIPIFPLDGSQLIFLMSKNKIVVAKLLKIFSIVFGVIFILLTIVSLFYKINITLSVFGLFVILSTFLDKDKFLYDYIAIRSFESKNYENGLKNVQITVKANMPLFKMVAMVNQNEIKEFIVEIDKNTNYIITERQLLQYINQNDVTAKIGDVIKSNNI